jgi:hypothetical protein
MRMIATLGVVAVLVMLVLGWAMAGRATAGGKTGGARDIKRGGGCTSCECSGGACQRPGAD